MLSFKPNNLLILFYFQNQYKDFELDNKDQMKNNNK